MKMKDNAKYIVPASSNIRTAAKKMDEGGIGFIAIVDSEEKIKGIVTDGDFRRAVLNGIDLRDSVLSITNKNYKYLRKGYSEREALDYFTRDVVECLPVLENEKVVDVILGFDLACKKDIELPKKQKLDLPVVIMAGGKGTRLDPVTRILPKALIPIGEKTIIEIIMDEYARHGMNHFYISVNYKGKMIKAYFEDNENGYHIEYISESKPLGTIGALRYLAGKIDKSFFISNCDIIIKNDYSSILKFHREGKYDLTLVGSLHHQIIPYGVCSFENGGLLKSIEEKPEHDFMVNTGMYLLNPDMLTFIPENRYFDVTDLIAIMQKMGHRIGVYPVSEKSWIDVGQWKEYKKAISELIK